MSAEPSRSVRPKRIPLPGPAGRSAAILGVEVDGVGGREIARRSRGTPRVANRLLRRMRDYAQVWGRGVVDPEIVHRGMQALMIDALGLDKLDRDILKTIIQAYEGGPVGSETLAISIGESVDTLEDVYEPYLIQRGLLQRTPRGRMATRLAYEHLELPRPGREDQSLLL